MRIRKRMKASEVREKWSEAIETVATEKARIVIERSGIPVAGLVSARDLEWLALRDQRLDELRTVVDRMRNAFTDLPAEEVEAEVERVIDELRRDQQDSINKDTSVAGSQ